MAGQSNGGGEKTEKPTAKKLKDAAKNGDILQSRELGTALVVTVGVAWLMAVGPMLVAALQEMLVRGLRFDRGDLTDFAPGTRGASLLSGLWVPVGGVMLATVAAAIVAPAVLGSVGFRSSGFAPKFSKLNPANGLKRIFGMQGLVELGKSILKVLLLGSIGLWVIWGQLAEIATLGSADLSSALPRVGDIFMQACLVMACALLVVAGVDVPSQIFQRGKRLAMSKQDIKDEYKETEGSPELKGQIRRRQFETLSASARKEVAEASVVLMNPTHFAVALRYRPGLDAAPVVVARGCDAMAFAIRDLAEANAVPVLLYPELTRAIYFTARVGKMVDEQLFVAVATILAFVFRVEKKMATASDRPVVALPDDMHFDADGRKTGAAGAGPAPGRGA